MSYKVVRKTKWGDVTIRGGFKSAESADMFRTDYKKDTPHIPGELEVVEEEVKTIVDEVMEELWQGRKR